MEWEGNEYLDSGNGNEYFDSGNGNREQVRKKKKTEPRAYIYNLLSLAICCQIPPGVQSHHNIRLSNRGIPRLNSYGNGDHYVHIKIKIPK